MRLRVQIGEVSHLGDVAQVLGEKIHERGSGRGEMLE